MTGRLSFGHDGKGSEEARRRTTGSPCNDCNDRECERTGKPCGAVEGMLPGERTGKSHRERLVGLDVRPGGDARRAVVGYRRRVIDFLRQTGRERDAEIAEKFFWRGLTQAQIAAERGVSQSTVSRALRGIEELMHKSSHG